MTKKGIKNKISRLVLVTTMVMGLFASVGAAAKVSAATGPAPSNWAFEESSRSLNDALVAEYPALGDANGYVTIPTANARTGNIVLTNKGITGTMNGIENFTSISWLFLAKNQMVGEIPSSIDNMTSLTRMHFDGNQFTGTIPDSIGDMTQLLQINLGSNNFTGTIPTNFGNLTNLSILVLGQNQLEGEIPDNLGNLSNLTYLSLDGNNLTGEIPSSVYSLPNLETAVFNDNAGLTGNPAIGFASSTTLNTLTGNGTNLNQARPNIPTMQEANGAVFLYDNLADELLKDSKTNLANGVTQEVIDKAQESANFVADQTEKQQWQDDIDLAQKMLDSKNKVDTLLVTPGLNDLKPGITIGDIDDAQDLVTALPNGTLKDELQAKIDTARNIVDAKDKVDGLLTTPDLSNLKPGVDAGVINDAQDAVNKLPAGSLKDELQDKIDTAKKLLDAENKVIDLFNPDGSLAPGVDQNKIDDAQKAVNLLPNGITKDLLQSLINEAQSLLDEQSAKSLKVSESTKVAAQNGAVNTFDNVNESMLAIIMLSSIAMLGVIAKRKINK